MYCSIDCINIALEKARVNAGMLKAALTPLGEQLKSKKDERNDVSDKTLETLKEVMYKQDDFGMNKYGVPLKDHYDYDWLRMFMEEMADGLKYIQNEIDRKNKVIKLLEHAISFNDFMLVESALGILRIKGTGK
jgi:hypothetical protein